MSTIITRWSRNAILARLAAFDAIDSAGAGAADRARRKVEVLRTVSALDAGDIDSEQAIQRFGAIARDTAAVLAVAA